MNNKIGIIDCWDTSQIFFYVLYLLLTIVGAKWFEFSTFVWFEFPLTGKFICDSQINSQINLRLNFTLELIIVD